MKIAALLLTLFVALMIPNFASSKDAAQADVKAASDEGSLRKFQAAFKKKKQHSGVSLPLKSIHITKDCSAETTCPNGTKLECSIVGPTTSCYSDANGVGCFKTTDSGAVSGSTGTC